MHQSIKSISHHPHNIEIYPLTWFRSCTICVLMYCVCVNPHFFFHFHSDELRPPPTQPRHPHQYWTKHENRRQFLIDLAKAKGLDPFKMETWNIITRRDIIDAKVSNNLPLFVRGFD